MKKTKRPGRELIFKKSKFGTKFNKMETSVIRRKLHQFIDTIEERKAIAIYTLFEEEIDKDAWEYSDEFKAILDTRYDYYKNGEKMISASEADEKIQKSLRAIKNK